MKKIALVLCAAAGLVVTGCESVKEITLHEDGSGKIITTNDMSGIIGLAKMQGGGEEMKDLEDQVIDTTFSLGHIADSLPDATDEEKALLRKGLFGVNLNLKEDKCIVKIELPFSATNQLAKLGDLSEKLMQEGIKKIASEADKKGGGGMPLGGDDMSMKSLDSYYKTEYTANSIRRTLDAEKYATVAGDEAMDALKQVAQLGMGNSTLVINLPRPAKKAEGAGLSLSEDKKKVTINNSAEDFFDDGKKLEFVIEF